MAPPTPSDIRNALSTPATYTKHRVGRTGGVNRTNGKVNDTPSADVPVRANDRSVSTTISMMDGRVFSSPGTVGTGKATFCSDVSTGRRRGTRLLGDSRRRPSCCRPARENARPMINGSGGDVVGRSENKTCRRQRRLPRTTKIDGADGLRTIKR